MKKYTEKEMELITFISRNGNKCFGEMNHCAICPLRVGNKECASDEESETRAKEIIRSVL